MSRTRLRTRGRVAGGASSDSGGGSAPANSVAPAITGTAEQGSTLTSSTGTWSGSPTYAYQWKRDGASISGATSSTYLLDNADVNTVTTCTVTGTNGSGSASATSAATATIALLTLPTTPVFRISAAASTQTSSGSPSRIDTINDLIGSAHGIVTPDAAGATGPKVMTDSDGRKFLRFEASQGLKFANGLSYNVQNMTVFMVGKVHRGASGNPIFCINVASSVAHFSTRLNAADSPVSAMSMRNFGKSPTVAYPYAMVGSQLQVLGGVSRSTANGAIRNYVNENVALCTQGTSSPSSGNTALGYYIAAPQALGSLGEFDLYEIVAYNSTITTAQADAIAAALVTAYAIESVKHQIIIEGDSISYGWPAAINGSGNCITTRIPPLMNYKKAKVVSFATSGAFIATVSARVPTLHAVSLFPNTSGGRNIVMLQIGSADAAQGGTTKAQVYSDLVALITSILAQNTGSISVEVVSVINIGYANVAVYPKLEDAGDGLHAKMRDTATFLTDCLANTGQAYEGKLTVLDLPAYAGPGTALFADHTAAGNTTYYHTDGVHPNELGTQWEAQAYADHINNVVGLT